LLNRYIGTTWSGGGENIANGQPDVASVMAAWWASPGHKANILGDYTDVGCASVGAIWVCDFAKLKTACFPEESIVTANGFKVPINALKIGDSVLDRDGSETKFVMWIRKEENNEMMTIKIGYNQQNSNVRSLFQ